MPTLSPSEDRALGEVSAKLGVDKRTLFNLINFESSWNPSIKNPYSSARGLIQFIDSTARGLGYSSSQDLVAKHPTRESQLRGPVYQYLRPYAPFPTQQSLYMSVFYPKFRKVHPQTEFPDSVQRVNPNIRVVQDYVDKVNRKAGNYVVKGGMGLGTILILALSYYYRKNISKAWKKFSRKIS